MVKIQDITDISAAGAVADHITKVQGAAAAGAQVEAQWHTEEEPRVDIERRRPQVLPAESGPEGMPLSLSLVLSLSDPNYRILDKNRKIARGLGP